MTKEPFEIGAEGVDVQQVMAEIKAAVSRKLEDGVYRDVRIARAEKMNLANLKDDETLLKFYLECLKNAACVDIGDFEIYEKRRVGAALLVAFKKLIWKLLKFYTYRLWSQQNQVNGLLIAAIEGMDEKYRNRFADLEKKLAALEGGKAEQCQPPNT
jgi:hypothetical protein